jgi:methionine aminopeptidase
VAEMHEATRAAIRPGVTTMELNEVAAQVLATRGARSNFLNYHGFPAVICTSPNDMIVHGIPGDYVLQEGDIISVDCGAIIEGYHGDAAYTAGVGQISDLAKKLMEVTERRGSGRILGRARIRGPRHWHRHAREPPGSELLAGHAGADPERGHGLRH